MVFLLSLAQPKFALWINTIHEKIAALKQLKELERNKLIEKKVLSAKPYRVEYSLTVFGKSLSPMYKFVSEWGIQYLKENGIDYKRISNCINNVSIRILMG